MHLTRIDNPEDKIRRAIIGLQRQEPFFAYLLMHMQMSRMPEDFPMQTMGVDMYGNLVFAEDFVMGLNNEEMNGVLCHEVLHVAFLHCSRIGNRNQLLANVAQDVVVNMMVTRAHLALPAKTTAEGKQYTGIPYDIHSDSSKFQMGGASLYIEKVSGKLWEDVYDELMKQFKEQNVPVPQWDVVRSMGWDTHTQGDDGASEEQKKKSRSDVEQEWSNALVEAANYAKQQGKLPAGMERYVDDLLKPKVAWKQLLLKYMRPFLTPVDWSYQRPHKKSQVLEVYLPNTLKESREVEVLVDTSGSIGKDELTEFLSEIVAIAQSHSHMKMWVTFIDAKVHNRYEVENGDIPLILSMEPQGGGGTDMEKGLVYVRENNKSVPVVIVLTDGYTNFNKRAKDFPFDVIWVLTSNSVDKVPYGNVVKMG